MMTNKNKIQNQLLVVPFNTDYGIDKDIYETLTEDEFFTHCFLQPDSFIDCIESANAKDSFQVDIYQDEVNNESDRRNAVQALENWVHSEQTDMYVIKGEAGTGKSTYLHYLKHSHKDMHWEIVDITKACDSISIWGDKISIPEFSNNLYAKTISSLLINMREYLFCKEDNKYNFTEIYSRFQLLLSRYNLLFEDSPTRNEVSSFFEGLININISGKTNRDITIRYAKQFAKGINELIIHRKNMIALFEIIMELFIVYLRCTIEGKVFVISLDNFERFIGSEEIYNEQFTSFVVKLRQLTKSLASDYPGLAYHYKMLLLMRNTSLRMFEPQQTAELFAHVLDLTNWFDVGVIIEKKVKWYEKIKQPVDDAQLILSIFNDYGKTGQVMRGLYFKIGRLFNYNKRIVVYFTANILSNPENAQYIKAYKDMWDNKYNIPIAFSKFAARSIIFRLILNELRKEGFFEQIITQRNDTANEPEIGLARKVLTVLYNNEPRKNRVRTTEYMSFRNLVETLYFDVDNPMKRLFDNNNIDELKRLSNVLFYMNYYNGRTDNWLHLIDIQYNFSNDKSKNLHHPNDLRKLIVSDQNYERINIRITPAGIAYLDFVVYHFEFFACKSVNTRSRENFFPDGDLPPLMCLIPAYDEILNKPLDTLPCVRMIKVVTTESISCINRVETSKHKVELQYNNRVYYHTQRIIHSHRGYIDNFIQCMNYIYEENIKQSKEFRQHYELLIAKLDGFRKGYSSD